MAVQSLSSPFTQLNLISDAVYKCSELTQLYHVQVKWLFVVTQILEAEFLDLSSYVLSIPSHLKTLDYCMRLGDASPATTRYQKPWLSGYFIWCLFLLFAYIMLRITAGCMRSLEIATSLNFTRINSVAPAGTQKILC